MTGRNGAAPGHVRIIGGRWRGTRLPVANLAGLRPSTDRVRETLFNWLQPKLPGARVLDLFAGSGALGLEALSRGARDALLVERVPELAAQLRAAVERLRAGELAHVVRADALALLAAPLHGRFDVVFVDPPFAADLWDRTLRLLPPWLAADAWLYLEAPVSAPRPDEPDWNLHREHATREVRYALYRRAAERRAGDAAGTLDADSRADGAATE
jgi:16S rRNA (guanine966-N2)-methyltransferase